MFSKTDLSKVIIRFATSAKYGFSAVTKLADELA